LNFKIIIVFKRTLNYYPNHSISDDLVKGHNLLYCCDPCLEVAHETRSFMSQTKGVLKGVISTFAAARDSFRRADGLRGIGLYTT